MEGKRITGADMVMDGRHFTAAFWLVGRAYLTTRNYVPPDGGIPKKEAIAPHRKVFEEVWSR